MTRKVLLCFCGLFLGALALWDTGCKKDDNSTGPGGGQTGLTTFSFSTPNQVFSVPASGGAARARLTGGTLPYSVEGNTNPEVAAASVSHDTLTVVPLAAGSTGVTIADSLGMFQDRIVTITITVTGGSSGGWGSGTMSAASIVGTLSFTGTGVWPAGTGPSVVAVYDTLYGALVLLGYQQVSGSHYNFSLIEIGGLTVGNYPANHTATFQVGYNADTSGTNVTYNAVNDSANVAITAVNGTSITGSYAGRAQLGANPSIQLGGSFNVVYSRGRSPIFIGGGTASSRAHGTNIKQSMRY